MLREGSVQAGEEPVAQPAMAELYDGIEPLRAGFQITLLRIRQGHGVESVAVAERGDKLWRKIA